MLDTHENFEFRDIQGRISESGSLGGRQIGTDTPLNFKHGLISGSELGKELHKNKGWARESIFPKTSNSQVNIILGIRNCMCSVQKSVVGKCVLPLQIIFKFLGPMIDFRD